MVLVRGACHPKAQPPGYSGLLLTKKDMESKLSLLKDIPILLEHDGQKEIGKIVEAHIDDNQRLVIDFDINRNSIEGSFAIERIRKGDLTGLSMGITHLVSEGPTWIEVVDKNVREVSVTDSPDLPNTEILHIEKDTVKHEETVKLVKEALESQKLFKKISDLVNEHSKEVSIEQHEKDKKKIEEKAEADKQSNEKKVSSTEPPKEQKQPATPQPIETKKVVDTPVIEKEVVLNSPKNDKLNSDPMEIEDNAKEKNSDTKETEKKKTPETSNANATGNIIEEPKKSDQQQKPEKMEIEPLNDINTKKPESKQEPIQTKDTQPTPTPPTTKREIPRDLTTGRFIPKEDAKPVEQPSQNTVSTAASTKGNFFFFKKKMKFLYIKYYSRLFPFLNDQADIFRYWVK